jgi:hypothetical protein
MKHPVQFQMCGRRLLEPFTAEIARAGLVQLVCGTELILEAKAKSPEREAAVRTEFMLLAAHLNRLARGDAAKVARRKAVG